VRGVQSAHRGDYYRSIENVSPEFISNLMRAIRMGEIGKDLGLPGHATNPMGRPLFGTDGQPVRMSTLDMLTKGAGFQPIDYSTKMRSDRTVTSIQRYFEDKRKNINDRYRIASANKDSAGMSDAFKRMSEFNREVQQKGATRLVSPMKASNMVKLAREVPTKKERKEIAFKKLEYEAIRELE
jgi:hypothetical protein